MRLLFASLLLAFFFLIPPVHAQSGSAGTVLSLLERGNIADAHALAKRTGDSVLATYVTWLYLRDSNTSPSIEEFETFLRNHSDWPDRNRLILRAEVALLASSADESTIRNWFAKYPPKSENAKLFKADLSGNKTDDLIRHTWIEGDFSESQEQAFLSRYASVLREQDQRQRAARLVWDEEYGAARRMLDRLPDSYAQVIRTRMALKQRSRNATTEVAKLVANLQNDEGLLFDRMVWRHRTGQDDGVQQILLQAPDDVPYAKEWWKYRERHVREAIDVGNIKLARRLLRNHGQTEGAELIDALFLSGWLHLEFEKQPQKAYTEFHALYDEAKFPHSRARAAYWAGRAAEKNGNKDIARGWYQKGGEHPTTYYGQLSLHELGVKTLSLPDGSKPSASEISSFYKQDMPRLVKLLVSVGEPDRALRFINHMAETSDSKTRSALVAQLGKDVGRMDFSVKASKRALQRGYILTDYAYPRMKLSFTPVIDRAVMFALTRQESEFNPRAVSPANAIGMMQLLPSTAKEVARKAGIGYSRSRLYEPEYNMRLGSLYFNRLLNAYDGSYILASVGYNAGPGRVRKWLGEYGSPGSDYRKAINWIEMIPFEETRNYVQRILENTQVYRHLLDNGKLEIAKDLTR